MITYCKNLFMNMYRDAIGQDIVLNETDPQDKWEKEMEYAADVIAVMVGVSAVSWLVLPPMVSLTAMVASLFVAGLKLRFIWTNRNVGEDVTEDRPAVQVAQEREQPEIAEENSPPTKKSTTGKKKAA